MSSIHIESTTDTKDDIERAGKLGPEGQRGMDTGMRVELPEDGTATVVSRQEIVTAKDNVQPRETRDGKLVTPTEAETETTSAEGASDETPEEDAEPEPSEEATPEAAKPTEGKPKGRGAARIQQVRTQIASLIAQKNQTQREVNDAAVELERLRTELARLRRGEERPRSEPARTAAPVATPTSEATAEAPPRPKSDDFDSYEAFIEALTEWKADRKAEAVEQRLESKWQAQQTAREREAAERAAAAQRDEVARGHTERLAAAREKYPDFDEIIGLHPTLVLTPATEWTVINSEVGPELLMHFGRHPEEAQKLAQMPVDAQLRYLGRLEAQVGSGVTPAAEPPARVNPTTKAKAPVAPVVQAPTAQSVDPDQLPYQEFKRYREQQLAARGRR